MSIAKVFQIEIADKIKSHVLSSKLPLLNLSCISVTHTRTQLNKGGMQLKVHKRISILNLAYIKVVIKHTNYTTPKRELCGSLLHSYISRCRYAVKKFSTKNQPFNTLITQIFHRLAIAACTTILVHTPCYWYPVFIQLTYHHSYKVC